jgi:hypothetical protein
VRLNETETEVRFSVTANELSGPATAMHFHEALPGVAGPIVIDLTDEIEDLGDGKMFAEGTVPIDAAFLGALRAGRIYLNVHTELNPTGEIRGQVVSVGAPGLAAGVRVAAE